ncbi:uncharacterized protein LOC132281879 [Cornus florida]|uniref:uncharacterized protein LOC132281879 n=1 Tax=Cornus florida TaxID=4283 RepID=UPI002899C7CA|nr:uncharacterized protein LOC132281879 [Cornus florida]
MGSGKNTHFWFDNWSQFGPLHCSFTSTAIDASPNDRFAKLENYINEESWTFPPPILAPIPSLPATPPPNALVDDTIIWDPSPAGLFSLKHTIPYFLAPTPPVSWDHLSMAFLGSDCWETC